MRIISKQKLDYEFKLILKCVCEYKATSIKEVEQKLNLRSGRVYYILKYFPEEKEKVLSRIKENKTRQQGVAEYLIDASITGSDDFKELFDKIYFQKNSIFILTNITVIELETLKQFNDTSGVNARYILHLASRDEAKFKVAYIDENFPTPDQCIIDYCDKNKNFILLTYDNAMALLARGKSIKVNIFEKGMFQVSSTKLEHTKEKTTDLDSRKMEVVSDNTINTFFAAYRSGGHLYIRSHYNSKFKSNVIISDGKMYKNTPFKQLKIGDDVYIIQNFENHINFTHVRIISLEDSNNSMFIFGKNIYDKKEIKELPIANYRMVVREFIKNFSEDSYYCKS